MAPFETPFLRALSPFVLALFLLPATAPADPCQDAWAKDRFDSVATFCGDAMQKQQVRISRLRQSLDRLDPDTDSKRYIDKRRELSGEYLLGATLSMEIATAYFKNHLPREDVMTRLEFASAYLSHADLSDLRALDQAKHQTTIVKAYNILKADLAKVDLAPGP